MAEIVSVYCEICNVEICALRLIQTLVSKEEEISSLQEERDLLNHRVTQLEEELQVLNKSFRDLKVYGFTHNAILKIRNQ